MDDKLESIFKKREEFMLLIKEKFPDTYPSTWPVNIKEKSSQSILRETALKGVEEMFEALQHLKNWKSHRETEITSFDREEFLEEIVDAFNYFFSLMILLWFGSFKSTPYNSFFSLVGSGNKSNIDEP